MSLPVGQPGLGDRNDSSADRNLPPADRKSLWNGGNRCLPTGSAHSTTGICRRLAETATRAMDRDESWMHGLLPPRSHATLPRPQPTQVAPLAMRPSPLRHLRRKLRSSRQLFSPRWFTAEAGRAQRFSGRRSQCPSRLCGVTGCFLWVRLGRTWCFVVPHPAAARQTAVQEMARPDLQSVALRPADLPEMPATEAISCRMEAIFCRILWKAPPLDARVMSAFAERVSRSSCAFPRCQSRSAELGGANSQGAN